MEDYFGTLGNGNHLVFTHGGPMTTLLLDYGVTQMPNNASFYGVTLDDQNIRDGRIKSMEFEWQFPVIEDDI